MDRETEEWYDNQFIMFSNTGWKDLKEQIKGMINTYNDLRKINDSDKFHFARGQLDILDWLDNWEDKVETTYKEIKDASKDL